jgi:hypothetical protein
MKLGTTLKSVEKKFGPAVAGEGDPETTFSAVRYPAGRAKKFAGLAGRHADAVFYLHFPVPVDWTLLKSKKGIPDFINDLSLSGPQGEQHREKEAKIFRELFTAKHRLKEKLLGLVGKKGYPLRIELDGEMFGVDATITQDKKGKVTLKILI